MRRAPAVAVWIGSALLAGAGTAQELGPLVSGSEAYVDGTFVWTDYAYDDHGANTDGVPGGDGSGGYPPGLENSADLIQLQIGLEAGEIVIRALLETLVDADTPVLGVAFDRDADPSTGAAALPGASWVPAAPLGVDLLVVVRASSAEIHEFSGAWAPIGNVAAGVDLAANTLETTLPAAVASPGGAVWRAFAVLGFRDPLTGDSWPEGDAILDLAFVGGERPVLLQSEKQGDTLGGLLDPAEAAAWIDFARVAAGDTELPPLPRGAFSTLLHHSALALPEGVQPASGVIAGLEYLGPYQPYLLWVPDPLPDPAPLHVFLHGASQNHLQDTWVNPMGWPYHGLSPDLVGGYAGNNKPVGTDAADVYLPNDGAVGTVVHFERSFAPYDAPGLVAFPLGRSNSSGYGGIHEEDVFEVIADLSSRIPVDPDRISLSGSSMGGIGSFRLAALHPDRWSHAFPLLGTGSAVEELYENLYNLPLRMHNGLLDPLVSQPGPSDSADAIDALGYDYRYWLFETREHESLFSINHCVRDQAFAAVRTRNPATVVFSVRPEFQDVDTAAGYAHLYDAAYWVSEVAVRGGSDEASLRATSFALPGRLHEAEPILAQHENVSSGRDECGPNPAVQTLDTWTEQGIALAPPASEPPPEKRVELELTGVASLSIDLLRAGLSLPGSVGDWDGDGVPDAGDNCPFEPNPGQADSGGLGTAQPDGRGDACQCGDVTDNGKSNGQDANAIRRAGLGIEPNPAFRVPCKCDVTGNGLCNGQDGSALRAAIFGQPSLYDPEACAARSGLRVIAVDGDGPVELTLTGLVEGTRAILDGTPAGSAGPAGSVAVAVPAGPHTLHLLPEASP